MYQQINLFQPVFRKQEKVFGAATLLQIAAAVLLLLLTIFGHARWTLAGMNRTAQTLEQQVEKLTGQLAALEASTRTPDTAALDSEITRLHSNIEQRNNLLVQFDQLVTQHENGFATRFEALASEHVPGLWLEGVMIDRDNHVELRGIALDAKLVPLFLQQLERRRDLSAKPFETVSVTRMDSNAPQMQFVLRNFKGEVAWQ